MAHTLPNHRKGDTFHGETFNMKEMVDGVLSPMSLVDAHIRIDFRVNANSPIVIRMTNFDTGDPVHPGGGITIVNAEEGIWQIDPQIINILPGKYVYDVEFTFPGDPQDIQTLIEGDWTIVQDITHD